MYDIITATKVLLYALVTKEKLDTKLKHLRCEGLWLTWDTHTRDVRRKLGNSEKIGELREKVFTRQEDEEVAFRRAYAVENENVFLNFEIYRAIKGGDPDKYVRVLCEKEKLSLSPILYQCTHGGDSMLHVAAEYGNEKIAELVASYHPFLLEALNIEGNTALHEAARSTEGGSNVRNVILSQHDAWQRKKVENITKSKNRVGNAALHEAVML